MVRPSELRRIDDATWELPRSFKEGMQVPVRFFATEKLMRNMDEGVFDQAANVAGLPGILNYSYCMPDAHRGYGFPIGGVAAMDPETGVISPGGIGFDINCGMRLIRTDLTYDEVVPKLPELIDTLFKRIPCGVGKSGLAKLSHAQFGDVIEQGARWCAANGYATPEDLEHTEEGGCLAGADASRVSKRAFERGHNQVGTLGSGNHYLEVQVVKPENIADRRLAAQFGIDRDNQVVIMFHCGSRGFGHQVASDYLQRFLRVAKPKYGLDLRDRELACAPFQSPEGQDYFAAMACAVNMAFANRQVIFHRVRDVLQDVFHRSPDELGVRQVYDVCHNTAKLETHVVNGREQRVLVHRKGATRAFGPGMAGVPDAYRDVGQPVILGGSMETGSYLLCGVASGSRTFFSTAHGSGRVMSRSKARKTFRAPELRESMRAKHIYVRAASASGLSEEAGGAYKSIDDVVEATQQAGLSKPVVRVLPIGCIKG